MTHCSTNDALLDRGRNIAEKLREAAAGQDD
jgi:hypothetical protein